MQHTHQKELPTTLPILLLLNAAVGASFALAGNTTLGKKGLVQTPAFWVLMLFELFVALPQGAYLLFLYADWSLMYVVDADHLIVRPVTFCLLYPLFGVLAFHATAEYVRKKVMFGAFALFVFWCVGVGAMLYVGMDRIMLVGSYASFKQNPALLEELMHSKLMYALFGLLGVWLFGWVAGLWRLWVLRRAAPKGAVTSGLPWMRSTVECTKPPY